MTNSDSSRVVSLPGRASLSVCIITKNNAATIRRTLESVAGLADEIVGLDSGSTDDTITLLEAHNARVLHGPWKGFIAMKQQAMDACTRDWILCLDADESLDKQLRDAIENVLASDDPTIDGYRFNRKVWYLGGYLNHAWQPEWRLRLVRRGTARQAGQDPHDHIELLDRPDARRVGTLPGTLRHDALHTMGPYLEKQVRHGQVAARSLADAGRRGRYRDLFISPPGAFFKQLILKQAWRDGPRGWVAAASTALSTLAKHIILIEQTRCPPPPSPPPSLPLPPPVPTSTHTPPPPSPDPDDPV